MKGEPASVVVQLELAELCQRYKKWHRDAVGLFAKAFDADPKAVEDLAKGYRYNAACAAAVAAVGQSTNADQLQVQEKTRLRKQATDWLQADLAARARLLEKNPVKTYKDMQLWLSDSDLSGVREGKELAKLPGDERAILEKFWGNVDNLAKQARSSYIQTEHKGQLSTKECEQTFTHKMTAAKRYTIDMESSQFDSYLRLEDAKGKAIAEDDDSGGSLNARALFSWRPKMAPTALSPRRSTSMVPVLMHNHSRVCQ